MLAKKEVSYTTHTEASYLADLVPAIASTVPFSPDSAVNWLEAVSDIIATLNAARIMHRAVSVRELQAAVDQLLAAGVCPLFASMSTIAVVPKLTPICACQKHHIMHSLSYMALCKLAEAVCIVPYNCHDRLSIAKASMRVSCEQTGLAILRFK